MKNSIRFLACGLAALALGCSGGIKVSGHGSQGGSSSGDRQDVDFTIGINATGGSFSLLDAPINTIYPQHLNFTMDCTGGGGSATEPFMANGTSSGNSAAFVAATFTTSVPSYCLSNSIVVVSLVGKFDDATTGMTFTLKADDGYSTYHDSTAGWDVHASFTHVAGPPIVWTATFEFDTSETHDTPSGGTITARETVNGNIVVDVNDRCNGAATVTSNSATAFTVKVPHSLVNPVQWTEVISDNTDATSPYIEQGAAVAGKGQWKFDFASATTTDHAVHYKLTISGDLNTAGDNLMLCVADLTVDITNHDGTPTTIP